MKLSGLLFASLTLGLPLSGACITSPTDGSRLDTRAETQGFSGLTAKPNQRVEVVAIDQASARFKDQVPTMASTTQRIGVAYTGSTPYFTDSSGQPWYLWSLSASKLPQSARLWIRHGTTADAELTFQGRTPDDGVTLAVYNDTQLACVFNEVSDGHSVKDAHATCGSASSGRLVAPCDTLLDGFCYDVPGFSIGTNYPDDREWFNDIQGVTHDHDAWYFTVADKDIHDDVYSYFYRVPVTEDLDEADPTRYVNPWQGWWDHMGSPTYVANPNWAGHGRMYVPLEPSGGTANRPALGQISVPEMTYAADAFVLGPYQHDATQHQGSMAWVAHEAASDTFYSSESDNLTEIHQYRLNRTTKYLDHVRKWKLLDTSGRPLTLDNVCGGMFSSSGRLYLLSDLPPPAGGLYVFSLEIRDGARLLSHTQMPDVAPGHPYDNFEWGPDQPDEFEGFTIWDLDDGRAPGITGQIHVVVLDNDLSIYPGWVAEEDDFFFKHVRVSDKSQL